MIKTTFATPQNPFTGRPVKKVAIHPPSGMKICDDAIPAHRGKTVSKYSELFASIKIGQAIKCKPDETHRVSQALRAHIRKNHINGMVRTINDFGDGMGRVWLIKARVNT